MRSLRRWGPASSIPEIWRSCLYRNRGTLARQAVKKVRPKAILAVACERDLTSGIQDVFPMPVIGVLNRRPNGPCFNTSVDIDAIEEEIKTFISGKDNDHA